jgi:hypothetical protein
MVPSIGREITVIGPDTAHSARVLTPEGFGFVRRTRGRPCRRAARHPLMGDFQEFLTVAGYRLLDGQVRAKNARAAARDSRTRVHAFETERRAIHRRRAERARPAYRPRESAGPTPTNLRR